MLRRGKPLTTKSSQRNVPMCTAWECRRETDAFEEFKSTHKNECEINHEGSAGAMECNGIKEMDRKPSDRTKMSRKRDRAVRKGFGDKERVREGPTYGSRICEVLNDTLNLIFIHKFYSVKFNSYFLKT